MRDSFVAIEKQTVVSEKLDHLNHNFSEWVDEYNNRVHGTTKQSPYNRYRAKLECIRPAPAHLLNYFRQIEFRRVKKDRTVRLMGHIFEAPVSLIDRQVELRFHPEDLSAIEIFFQSKSYGLIQIVSPHVNSKIGRNWDPKSHENRKNNAQEEFTEVAVAPSTGQLNFQSELTSAIDGEIL